MIDNPTPDPIEPDKITNADESKELPGPDSINITPPEENDELDKRYEGIMEGGNVAAEDEEDTDNIDGTNANNLRTK